MISAKARTKDDRSDGVVVSFGAHWHGKLLDAAFSRIIRKRVPISNHPRWLYFYIKSPISKICGRAKIISIKKLTKEDVTASPERIGLSVTEILHYMGEEISIGCYDICDIQIAQYGVSAYDSKIELRYSPPQSFFFLSIEGKLELDRVCRFVDPQLCCEMNSIGRHKTLR